MVDPTGLLSCIYVPDYFDTTGCVLTNRIVKDLELTDWRKDLPIILDTWNVPLPEFVIGGRLPSKRGPPWKPDTGRTKDYVEVQLGFFNVERLYKSNLMIVQEEWACCGTTKKRTITCTSDWTQTDTIKYGPLGLRFYQKTL